jgi:hypothetical protein
MGLDLRVDEYPKEELSIGYIGFGILRRVIASSYNKEFGELYDVTYQLFGNQLTLDQLNRWNEICDDDLDILLNHSDCDGILKYHECRKVIRALDRIAFNYPDDWRQDWKEKYFILKDMIRYCAKNRKRLYFK